MRKNEILGILRKYNIQVSKRLGQHFLVDKDIVKRQVEYANIGNDDIILEIGPGLGMLTNVLINKCKSLIAIEEDKKICNYLKKKFGSGLELIHADALKIDFPYFDKIVSNLPYGISSPITFKLLDYDFKQGILMYQKEFAQRMIAQKGKDYSRLSINVYYRASCEILEIVPQEAFYPEPMVDGAIVKLKPRKAPKFKVLNEKLFFKVVDVLFTHRRKKIENSLILMPELRSMDDSLRRKIMGNLSFQDSRPEELTPEQLGMLSDELENNLQTINNLN